MIFVAGGAGYIGSHINKYLNKKAYRTIVYDNLVCGHREFAKWGEFVLGDLADKDLIRHCFQKCRIEAVMHFSSFAYVGESVVEPAKYYENNVVNTINLLEVMREFKVKYFIFSSTCATYGTPSHIPIPEEHPQNPVNPYGKSKLMVETILKDYDSAYGMKHINLRYFNAAGADPDYEIGERHAPETHLIPLAIHAALGFRDKIEIFGVDYPTEDGTCIRDYIHVTDLADAHIKALEHLKKTNTSDSFNLGSSKGYSVRTILGTVRRLTGKDFRVTEAGRRAGDPAVLVGSNQKALEILDWRPRFSDIETIVETALCWHRKDMGNTASKKETMKSSALS